MAISSGGGLDFTRKTVIGQVAGLPWAFLLLICGMAAVGVAVLYSATFTNPEEAELPMKHAVRFGMAFAVMFAAGLVPLRYWFMLAWPSYGLTLFMLLLVEFFGQAGGGAERWLDFNQVPVIGWVLFFDVPPLQPSEPMKVTLTLALAAYYHKRAHEAARKLITHVPAALLMLLPAALIFRQPDFGTTLALLASGGLIIFLASLSLRVIIGMIVAVAASIPLIYSVVLQDYQRERVDTFVSQLSGGSVDDLGDGYQIGQAKIAIGSGGLRGKGYMEGTQAQLDYIPEQHTDFILTVPAEEFGFLITAGLLVLWAVIFGLGLSIAQRASSAFGQFAAAGAVFTMAFYIIFNVGMVLGLLPVVGVPFPLWSYGGTVMLTSAACFGLICAVHLGRNDAIKG